MSQNSFDHYFSYYQDVEFDLELRHGQQEWRSISLELGGRIGVFARDAQGEALPANVELRAASGEKLDVKFVAIEGSGRFNNTWRLSTRGRNETYPNLPPGDFELHLWYEGFLRQVIPVTVTAGATTKLDVVLEPR